MKISCLAQTVNSHLDFILKKEKWENGKIEMSESRTNLVESKNVRQPWEIRNPEMF